MLRDKQGEFSDRERLPMKTVWFGRQGFVVGQLLVVLISSLLLTRELDRNLIGPQDDITGCQTYTQHFHNRL